MTPLALVPRDYAEQLQDQLDAAMQIIAALVLTDEEVIAIQTKADSSIRPERCKVWSERMRSELLDKNDEYGRPRLVEVIRRQGFLMNTHAGFCTGPLERSLPAPYHVADVTPALIQVTEAYARGEGQTIPNASAGMPDAREMVREAIEPGPYPDELAPAREAVLDLFFGPHGVGTLRVLEAMCTRMVPDDVPPQAETRGSAIMQKAALDIFAEVLPRLQEAPADQWAQYGGQWVEDIQRRIAALDPAKP